MALAFTALAAATAVTTNATSYAGTAGTPVAGDLLICFVSTSALSTANNVNSTMTGTFTWSKLTSFGKNAGADSINVFWAYAATATSTTPTFNTGGVTATGCAISCVRVTGAEGQTQPYIRQFATNNGSTANPTVVFGAAPLTGNGILAIGANSTNSNTQWTAPAGFTEISEVAFNTPANSLQTVQRATGQTVATLTWTNVNTSGWGTFAMEFYTAGTGPQPDSSAANKFGDIVAI